MDERDLNSSRSQPSPFSAWHRQVSPADAISRARCSAGPRGWGREDSKSDLQTRDIAEKNTLFPGYED